MTTATTAATKNRSDLKAELLSQEHAYLEAVQSNDGATIAALTDECCLIVSGQGAMTADAPSIQEMAEQHDSTNDYEIDESSMTVLSLTDDVAVTAYKLRTIPQNGRATEAYDTDVWVRRDGRWLCAAHTETPVSGA